MILSRLRISELTALRWQDVDLASGTLYVRTSKTDAGERARGRVAALLDD